MRSDQRLYVYILASRSYGTLYIGQTNDLARRMYEHKNSLIDGFTKKYNVKTLVYYEVYENSTEGFVRERRLKEWKRDWKLRLIIENNPKWHDLSEHLL